MKLDPARLAALAIPRREIPYTDREVMHYALAVGLGAAQDLPFLYERDLRVVPSLATMLAFDDSWLADAGIDLRQVVHGALDLRFHRPLAAQGVAEAVTRITGLGDKGEGRGGLVHQETVLSQGGAAACTVLSTMFVRGAGGFGGDVGTAPEAVAIPAGAPGDTAMVATVANQALLFRLLGDRNPLHVDPEVAKAAGFAAPILHGACTFGIACAEALRRFCDRDPGRLTRLAARFAGPLYPGETLRFSFWRDAEGVVFRAEAAQRGAIVLDNGRVGLLG
ncbi:MaoC/PaaZ C-terminal domain-containing protein [Humitalea sp. 24SJ18S-53]|uniref:MaoC family dehydratase n=1 Tax=Humitalea sp. 24SJ18S-53 TaxID=3422307 RepID=UPI003D67EFEA